MFVIFECNNPKCDNSIKKFFRKAKDIPSCLECDICKTGQLERQISSPYSKSTTIIDNGKYQRQVEVNNDIVEQQREKVIKEG